jgi:hypothetical protein
MIELYFLCLGIGIQYVVNSKKLSLLLFIIWVNVFQTIEKDEFSGFCAACCLLFQISSNIWIRLLNWSLTYIFVSSSFKRTEWGVWSIVACGLLLPLGLPATVTPSVAPLDHRWILWFKPSLMYMAPVFFETYTSVGLLSWLQRKRKDPAGFGSKSATLYL